MKEKRNSFGSVMQETKHAEGFDFSALQTVYCTSTKTHLLLALLTEKLLVRPWQEALRSILMRELTG